MREWVKSIRDGSAFYRRARGLRWAVPLAMLGLVAVHQWLWQALRAWLPPAWHFWLAVGLDGLSGSVAAWLALDWLAANAVRQERTRADLRAAYDSLAETHRQLLAVHDIGREIASAADMQQVLELAARAPVHLAGAVGSAVITLDQERDRLNLDMAWGLSDDYLLGFRRRLEAGVPAGRCQSCESLAGRVSGDCPLFEGMQDLARAEGIQSLICLPVVRDKKREGIISAYFPSPDGPPEDQVQLLNIVATEIAAAMDSVRLRANHMATLYAVENLSQSGHDLGGFLEQILAATLAGWGAPGGAIFMYDPAGEIWHHWVQSGLGDGPNDPSFDLALRLAEESRQQGQPILIQDLALRPGNGARPEGLRSAAAAPLIVGGEVLGALVMLAGRAGLFQPRQASFFQTIAHQAALAISNARLHAQVQQMAVLEERYRLSREMHDGLAQTLSALGWQLDRAHRLLAENRLEALQEDLALGRRMVRDAYMDVREAIDGLRLTVEHRGGLPAALEEYVADFEIRTGIGTVLEIEGNESPLPAEMELQLLRIVQEALTNARKHAAASRVSVRLQYAEDGRKLMLTVADDGRGFDPALPRGRGHLGMNTMRERAQSQGGDLMVVTGPNQGTRITVALPLESQ
ncbi:MAG: GAF domain-containing sensor histidine kinase [Chloroflexota bacterium]